MTERINPVKETYSPMSKAMYEFEKARNDLNNDLPGVVEVIDKHETLVRLQFALMEQQFQQHQNERQKIVKTGIGAFALALLFPPYSFRGIGYGHHFILTPPKLNPQNQNDSSYAPMDTIGLLAILIGIAVLTWAATQVKWGR